jgi:hypothetical protein
MVALRAFVADRIVQQYADHVLVDGSFITTKAEPDDVDLVVGLKAGSTRELLAPGPVSKLIAIELLEGRFTDLIDGNRAIHGFAGDVGGPKYEKFRAYFQRSDRRGEPPRKGILRVDL